MACSLIFPLTLGKYVALQLNDSVDLQVVFVTDLIYTIRDLPFKTIHEMKMLQGYKDNRPAYLDHIILERCEVHVHDIRGCIESIKSPKAGQVNVQFLSFFLFFFFFFGLGI